MYTPHSRYVTVALGILGAKEYTIRKGSEFAIAMYFVYPCEYNKVECPDMIGQHVTMLELHEYQDSTGKFPAVYLED